VTAPARTVIVGLGNPVRGDDGVGLVVASQLRNLLATRPVEDVVVRLVERAGFELIEVMANAHNAVIIDCLDVPSPVPGRVGILTPADVRGSARLTGGHDIGLGVALELGRLLGIRMPESVVVVGIEGGDTSLLREDLTPAVALAASRVAEWLHQGLRLGLRHTLASYVERRCASASDLP
jgi:hydrogenase maturation protease